MVELSEISGGVEAVEKGWVEMPILPLDLTPPLLLSCPHGGRCGGDDSWWSPERPPPGWNWPRWLRPPPGCPWLR